MNHTLAENSHTHHTPHTNPNTMTNQEWQLISRPVGAPTLENFKQVNIADPSEADLKEGEVLVEMQALSVDPYMRARMDGGVTGYITSFELNEAVSGFAAGVVKASKSEKYPAGSFVTGMIPFRKVQILAAEGLTPAFPSEKVKLTWFLGFLGLTGLGAYLPIKHIGEPKEGETVFVSGAAGAVGSAAVQIFKQMGCKVYGCAGSDDKVEMVKKLGVEDAFNYKTTDNYTAKLAELMPNGIDIYFDNVGGAMLEAVLNNIAVNGRVIACGAISQYNNKSVEEAYPIRNLPTIIFKCVKMQGFVVFQWAAEFEAAIETLMGFCTKDGFVVEETVMEGFDKMPEAMIGVLSGTNTGKMIVKL